MKTATRYQSTLGSFRLIFSPYLFPLYSLPFAAVTVGADINLVSDHGAIGGEDISAAAAVGIADAAISRSAVEAVAAESGRADVSIAVDRNAANSIDQRFDTLNELGDMDWAIKVPNGTYSVYVAAGDPVTINAFYGIMVEGKRAVWGAPTQDMPWVGGTVTVDVTDGTLTLRRAVGSKNNKLNFIQIVQQS